MANGSQYTVVRDFADDGAGAPGRSEKKEMQACADVIAFTLLSARVPESVLVD